MSARADIIGDVRRALAGAPPAPVIERNYVAPSTAGTGEVVERFIERVADYQAVVERCDANEVAQRIARAIPQEGAVVVPAGLSWQVPGAVEDTGLSARELDAVHAVVTAATAGIAETGTILLQHGEAEGRRALSLVPDLHVCVIRADQIVADVPEVMSRLDPRRPTTWISGPSATSDIELIRVEGVHGPHTLHVIVVGT